MAITPAQLISVIRFHLNEMKARNAHHDFEHMCRHISRHRVYSNILPATGPVGAGGDKGRDFETYKTSSTNSFPTGSSFFERSSGGRKVIFCCSLQEAIESKIRSDVKKNTTSTEVVEIVYFCESNLPIAKRIALQRWALEEHRIELQIFDGQAISELLADREILWIAQEYLHIPAELAPVPARDPHWYQEARQRWKSRQPISISQADFNEIKNACRHATFNAESRADIALWITHLETFLGDTTPRALQRNALYEIAVASLRGKGDMTSQTVRLLDYYSDLEDWPEIADLQDAATLTVYSFGAQALGAFQVDATLLYGWRDALIRCLDLHLAEATGPVRRSGLLRVRGYLCILPLKPNEDPPFDEGFDYWSRMLDEAEQTPLFPVEEFSSFLSKSVVALGQQARFEALTERVDLLITKRGGNAKAAEQIYNRGVSFYDQGEITRAIQELHSAQAKWLSGDTLSDFLQATLFLANCYGEIGFAYAAKYLALAAAFVAKHTDDEQVARLLPRALLATADADDVAGNSFSYIWTLLAAFSAHCEFDPDPLNFDVHPELPEHLGGVAALRGLALAEDNSLVAAIDDLLGLWPPSLRATILRHSEDPTGYWARDNINVIWKEIEAARLGPPFGDVGKTRRIQWRALGITWTLEFQNQLQSILVAEQLAAQLQLAQAAFAKVDICAVPTHAHLKLALHSGIKHIRIRNIDSQERMGPTFEVDLPLSVTQANLNKKSQETLQILGMLLRACSVLPDADLINRVETTLKQTLSRIFVVRPYSELYQEFMIPELFATEKYQSLNSALANRRFAYREHSKVGWIGGEGPTYSRSVSEDAIRQRYRRGFKSVRHTVTRLMGCPKTRAKLEAYRLSGMKDWEILSIISNIALNIRYPLKEPFVTPKIVKEYFELMEIEEDFASSLSPDLFTDETIERGKRTYLSAFLNSWGLAVAPELNDATSLELFAIHRYGLRADDVEHTDIFGWADH
jgi:hypothetical protein